MAYQNASISNNNNNNNNLLLETSSLFQRLSVAVQRGNAICFASTLPW